ncbi:hypothetical protein BOX15_Mlig013101g1, partial [Macrostomum lignano]
ATQEAANKPRPVKVQWQRGDIAEEYRGSILETVAMVAETHPEADSLTRELKNQLDAIYAPTWQVVVGKSFSSYVTHEKGSFGYIQCNQLAVMIFRAGL